MSIEDSGSISRQIMELESLRRQTRRVHLWTTAALIGIVIVGVSAILTSLCHLTQAGPKQDAFLSHLGTRLQRDVLPAMGRLADPSVKRLKPAVEAELKRLDRRAPDVAEAGLRELSILGRNLPARSGLILQQTLGKALEAREERLRQALPGVTDQQIVTLLDSLQLEAQDQLLKSGEKLFNPHLNSIQSILANLEKIETTEPVDVKEDVNSWQVAFLFLDVFTREFKDLAVTETAQLEDPEQ